MTKPTIFLYGAVFGVALCIAVKAFAAEAPLPIRTNLVQCGRMEDMEQSCREDARCCVFIEPAAGDLTPRDPDAPASVTDCEIFIDDFGNLIPMCTRSVE